MECTLVLKNKLARVSVANKFHDKKTWIFSCNLPNLDFRCVTPLVSLCKRTINVQCRPIGNRSYESAVQNKMEV